MEKRIAIIGAGISGLLACKYAVQKGFNPTVFEAQSSIGGVWTQTIESTKLQTAKQAFHFTDFPWPSSVKEHCPPGSDVLRYIELYAEHFGLLSYIKFNSRVISIDYVGDSDEEMLSWEVWSGNGNPFGAKGKWKLLVQQLGDNSLAKEYVVEFVVLCSGRFSGLPNIPDFPLGQGPEVFGGKVIHSMEYSAMDNASAAELIKGKRIAVIGSQKSAVDIAAECADANGAKNPCIMIQRTVDWMLPSAFFWGVSFALLYGNRFSELLVHKPGETIIHSILATLLSPLRWGISKFVESYLRWKLPLKKYRMIPKHSFLQQASSCKIFFLPQNFYGRVEEGSIVLKQSKGFCFCKEGLILDGESHPLKADLVILATGYKGQEKLRNIFTSQTFQNYIMGSSTSTLPLYRQIIPPRIPQLAIVGFAESFSNLTSLEIRCQWLAHLLCYTFKLPSIKEMEKDISMWEKYMKEYGGGEYKRSCIGAVHIWYCDQLCKDIGCNPRRKGGFFSELFVPYGPDDYVGLAPRK
nr:probable flavin-containing monooxygenase 1 [Ipomoea trifida]